MSSLITQQISFFSASTINNLSENEKHELTTRIDILGEESGQAQGLNGPITSISKLIASDNGLLVWSDENFIPVGFIKYGTRDLYFYMKNGKVVQRSGAMCVLDFYVRPEFQRHGVGAQLFKEMIQRLQGISPSLLAYDRPSPKLISFLSKHYGLVNADIQPNRFAIYDGYLS